MNRVPEYHIRSLLSGRAARDVRDVGVVALGVIMVWLTQARLPGWGVLVDISSTLPWHVKLAAHPHLPAWGALALLALASPLVEFEQIIVVFAGVALGQFIPHREPWLATAWLARELPTVGLTIWCISSLIHRGVWWGINKRAVLAIGDGDTLSLAFRDFVVGAGLVWTAVALLPQCFVGPSQVAHAAGMGWQIAAICLFTIVTGKAEMDRAYSADIRPPLLEHFGLSVTTRTEDVIAKAIATISSDALIWLGQSGPGDKDHESQRKQPQSALQRFKVWLFAEEEEDNESGKPGRAPHPHRYKPQSMWDRIHSWLFAEDQR